MAKKSAKNEMVQETPGVHNERLDHTRTVDLIEGTTGDDDQTESREWEEEKQPQKIEY